MDDTVYVECPYCKKRVSLNKDLKMRKHWFEGATPHPKNIRYKPFLCRGSYQNYMNKLPAHFGGEMP